MDVLVKNHILEFMSSNTVGEAQQILNITDSDSTDFLTLSSNIDTLQTSVYSLSSDVDELTTAFDTLSSELNVVSVLELGGSGLINLSYKGDILYWGGTTNISLSVSNAINVPNFTVTVAQLSSGTVTITKVDSYDCQLISYGDLFETAGPGAIASLISIPSDRYLITGILQ